MYDFFVHKKFYFHWWCRSLLSKRRDCLGCNPRPVYSTQYPVTQFSGIHWYASEYVKLLPRNSSQRISSLGTVLNVHVGILNMILGSLKLSILYRSLKVVKQIFIGVRSCALLNLLKQHVLIIIWPMQRSSAHIVMLLMKKEWDKTLIWKRLLFRKICLEILIDKIASRKLYFT